MSNTNAHKPGYKHTPLGWIPEEWKINTFGDIAARIVGGGTPSRDNPTYWNGMIYWATVKDLSNFDPYSTQETISEAGLNSSSSNVIPAGTIITATRMALGKVVRFNIDVAINQDLKAVFPKSDIDNDFTFQWFIANSTKIQQKGNGSTVKGITLEDLKSLKFFTPDCTEQRKIAAILTTWDEAIQKTLKLIGQLIQRNKGLSQQLLSGKMRLNGYSGKWSKVPMHEIFERVQRKSDHANNDIEVLTISGRYGFMSQNDKFNRVIAGNQLKNYILLRKGEFSYNKGNSNAYQFGCVFRMDHYEQALVPNVYISFKATREMDTTFFAHYFKHDLLKPELAKIISSGARMDGLLNVSADDFLAIRVPFPQVNEQTAIGKVLTAANNELKLYEQQLTTLQEQKKGLMQKLLSGEVRVTNNQKPSAYE